MFLNCNFSLVTKSACVNMELLKGMCNVNPQVLWSLETKGLNLNCTLFYFKFYICNL